MFPIFSISASRIIDSYGVTTSLKVGTIIAIFGAYVRTFINYDYYFAIFGMALLGIARAFILNA